MRPGAPERSGAGDAPAPAARGQPRGPSEPPGPGGVRDPGPPAWLIRSAVGLTALLALARFFGLGSFGLWIDEAHTLHDALAPGDASTRYPLGYWATRASIALFGGRTDELVLRLSAAVFGALGLLAVAWAFHPALGRGRAWVAALLLASSSWHLYWSQSARAYTLAQTLSLLGAGFYLRGLLAGDRRSLLLGFLVAGSAAFAHPSAALLLPAWVLAPLALPVLRARLSVPPPRRLLAGVALLGGLALAGWGLKVYLDYQDSKQVVDWFGSWRHFVLSSGFYVTPWLSLGAALGVWCALRGRRPSEVLAALVVASVATSGLLLALLVRVSAQYVFVLLPWIALLATVPLGSLRGPARGAAYLALLVLPGLVDTGLYFGPRHGNRPRWREAFEHVFEHRAEHDLVFGMAAVVGQYYFDPGSVNLREQRDLVRLNPYTAREPARWSRRGRRTWFVLRREDLDDWPADERALFEELLEDECTLELELPVRFTPRDLSIEVWRREPWAAPR